MKNMDKGLTVVTILTKMGADKSFKNGQLLSKTMSPIPN